MSNFSSTKGSSTQASQVVKQQSEKAILELCESKGKKFFKGALLNANFIASITKTGNLQLSKCVGEGKKPAFTFLAASEYKGKQCFEGKIFGYELRAFIKDEQLIVYNNGKIEKSESPEQQQAVVKHEANKGAGKNYNEAKNYSKGYRKAA